MAGPRMPSLGRLYLVFGLSVPLLLAIIFVLGDLFLLIVPRRISDEIKKECYCSLSGQGIRCAIRCWHLERGVWLDFFTRARDIPYYAESQEFVVFTNTIDGIFLCAASLWICVGAFFLYMWGAFVYEEMSYESKAICSVFQILTISLVLFSRELPSRDELPVSVARGARDYVGSVLDAFELLKFSSQFAFDFFSQYGWLVCVFGALGCQWALFNARIAALEKSVHELADTVVAM